MIDFDNYVFYGQACGSFEKMVEVMDKCMEDAFGPVVGPEVIVAEICHCVLTGDIYIIRNGKGCEICIEPRSPFTVENVTKALDYLATSKSKEVPNGS